MMNKTDLNPLEQCWVIVGRRYGIWWGGYLIYLSEGESTSVRFNADAIFEREDRKKDIIGFVHTHPNFRATPSYIDHSTMHAWVSALGKPLICVIQGTDGLHSCWYHDDSSIPKAGEVLQAGKFICGVLPIVKRDRQKICT